MKREMRISICSTPLEKYQYFLKIFNIDNFASCNDIRAETINKMLSAFSQI